MAEINKAFTFIGVGPLYNSTYTYQQQACTTRFIAEAVVLFFKPQQLILVATETSKNEPIDGDNPQPRVAYLEQLLGHHTEVKVLTVPEGQSEADLWQIFNRLADSVEEGDRILFDITHGFRSLPLLALTVMAYLRLVKPGVDIQKVIYGAYDAVPRHQAEKPIFDLTLFSELMDWINAVSVFQASGDLSPVSKLLRQRQGQIYRHPASSEGKNERPKYMQAAGNSMQTVSEALKFNRLQQVQQASQNSIQLLEEAQSEIETWAQPFSQLIDSVRTELESLSADSPADPEGDQNLQKQYQQILWYHQKGQVTHVFLLAREWLVSVGCRQIRLDWRNSDDRQQMELMLGQRIQQAAKEQGACSPLSALLLSAWESVSLMRNDLAHFGMRPDPLTVQNIKNNVKRALPLLAKVAEEFFAVPVVK